MTNKLSELSKPEQFDAAVEIHGGEPFAVWAPAVNGSHVKKEQYFALLAWLEAKDKRITTVTEEREFWRERVDGAEKEREEFRRRFNLERSCLEDADKRIAELEGQLQSGFTPEALAQEERAESAEQRVAELESKLATPVRLPKRWDVSGQVNPPRIVEVQFEQQNRTHDQCAEAIRAAGFKVMGDE
ncbi:hypothetical protein [Serratia ureilytica]|uniref:hypothetical protein n=1 Tax=Serratia ureilytica TaxID=300181 RepID=UPI001E5E3D07|nr:hypothetical protein [Serratia ureilytica]